MNERKRFILETTAGLFSHSELCRRHERQPQLDKTGYKWLERYREGPDGLLEAPIGPIAVPTPLSPTSSRLPSSSAVIDPGGDSQDSHSSSCTPTGRYLRPQVLHRHFLREAPRQQELRRRRKPSHPGRPTAPFDAPNSIWSADFKGQFKTLDGVLPTHRPGWLQPLSARLSGLAGTTMPGFQTCLHPPLHEFGIP